MPVIHVHSNGKDISVYNINHVLLDFFTSRRNLLWQGFFDIDNRNPLWQSLLLYAFPFENDQLFLPAENVNIVLMEA